jgi:hypothetical protein
MITFQAICIFKLLQASPFVGIPSCHGTTYHDHTGARLGLYVHLRAAVQELSILNGVNGVQNGISFSCTVVTQ